MQGATGNTWAPMAVLLQLLLVALLYNAAPTMAARTPKAPAPKPSPSPTGACRVSDTKVAGCKTCKLQNKKSVCTGCTTGATFNGTGGGSCGEQFTSELLSHAASLC
jgi:hypothetical protein